MQPPTFIDSIKNSRNRMSLTVLEKKAVDEALKSIKTGNVYSHEKVMADMKKRYPFLKP
jgi:hypothetical protein